MAGRSTVENVDVKLTAKDEASPVVDKLAGKVDDVTEADHELEVTADTSDATSDVAHLDSEADRAAADREMTIRAAGLGDILDDLRDVQSGAQQAQDDLRSIGDGADDAAGISDGAVGKISTGLSQLPGPIGDIGQAFNDAADAAEGIGGSVQGLVPILGAVGGAALLFWNAWQDQADAAKRKLEEVKGAQLAMASGDMTKATEILSDAYAKYGKQLDAAGISQADFARMITQNVPLTDAQTQALNDQLGVIGLSAKSVEDLRKTWSQAADDTTRAQQAQFEMSKALGATTDQLMGMAGNSLPAVREQILRYIASTEGIPESKLTTVLTDADPNDVAQVKKILDDMAKDRDSTVTADAQTGDAESELDNLARTRTAVINAIVKANQTIAGIFGGGGGGTGRAAGAPTLARAALGAGALPFTYAPATYVVNVNMPLGAPTAEVGRYVSTALDAHERRVGARRRARS